MALFNLNNPLANTKTGTPGSTGFNPIKVVQTQYANLTHQVAPGYNAPAGVINYRTAANPVLPAGTGSGSVLGDSTTNSGSYPGGGSGGSAGSGIDPNSGLSYDQEFGQYQSQLGGLDGQLGTGNQNINDAYTTAYNQLLGNKDQTTRDYNNQKSSNLNNYVGARGQNQYQTGQQANSLQRLLGAHGYQGSANEAAGYAAARQGSIANQGLGKQYSQNQQTLDQGFGDYNNQWNNSANDLGHQRDVQRNSLQAKIDQTKVGLLQQLQSIANARGTGENYQGQIDALGNEANSLGREYANPVLQATPPTYQAPSLASYTVSNQAAPTVGDPSLSGAASNLDPSFVNLLLGSDQQKQNLNNIPQ